MDGILKANVGSGVPVTGGTCCAAIAACLHVPEQSLSKSNRCWLVGNVAAKCCRKWYRDGFQWAGRCVFAGEHDLSDDRAIGYPVGV